MILNEWKNLQNNYVHVLTTHVSVAKKSLTFVWDIGWLGPLRLKAPFTDMA